MAPKKNGGPMLFCEWVIGGPLPGARRAMKPKTKPKPAPVPPPREVIRVEVTTDDEKEEDTLKITFPRSGRKPSPTAVDQQAADAVVKRVRFEEERKSAKKSALKQSKSDESDSSATLAESSSDGESSDVSSKDRSKKNKEKAASDESESDGEPHPTCTCSRCVKRRKKSAKNSKAKDSASESEESASEDEKPKHKESLKGGKKQDNHQKKKDQQKGKKKDTSDADDEASECGKGTTDDEKEAADNKPAQTKAEKKKAAAEKNKQQKPKAEEKGESSKAADNEPKPTIKPSPFSAYPEAFPGPHVRRPNFIAPIRAQVVQTEDVVETPDDPPPNAFYDPAANVMRVYYGPVYGNRNPQQRSLYPRREAAGRPLSVGMPHPAQNPYYYGFQGVPGYDGAGGAPEWHPGFGGQPPGFPPFVMNPMFHAPNKEVAGNKGVFSKNSPAAAAAAAPSVSQADDKAGASNVLPTTKIDEKKTSPYYTPSKTAEELRNGSHRTSPAKSVAAPDTSNNQNDANNGWPAALDPTNATWGDGPANNNAGDSWNNGTNNGNTGDTWPSNDNNASNGAADNDSWDNDNSNNNNAGGGGNDNAAPSGGGDCWDSNNAANDAPPADTSNIIPPDSLPVPGAWEPSGPPPSWGDLTAAQSTKGKADIW